MFLHDQQKVCNFHMSRWHWGKLSLAHTSLKLISLRPKQFDEQDWLQLFCNFNQTQKIHLPNITASYEQNSLLH